jgi:hypothetical protein
MIPAVSIIAAIATALGVYLFFFDGLQDLVEQVTVNFLGSSRDYRFYMLFSAPIAIGLITYIFLLHLFGKPLNIPFL